MTKLHTKQNKLTSRRAVAPVIATLLLVAIAVVGGAIIFVFSQGFFSSAQISGQPQIESIEIVGYDLSDLEVLYLHDDLCSDGSGPAPTACATGTNWDGNENDGLLTGERVAVYVQNNSAQRVTLNAVSLAGTTYGYPATAPTATLTAVGGANDPAPGEYFIIERGVAAAGGDVKTSVQPVLEAGEEATILMTLDGGMSKGRDAQFKIETANGNIFVGTVIAGQQGG